MDKYGAVLVGKGGDTIGVRRVGKRGGAFDALSTLEGQVPGDAARSIEGWVLFVSGLAPETAEMDLLNLFAAYGTVMNVRMNLASRESLCVGHALIEYGSTAECVSAIAGCSGKAFLSSPQILVSNAFVVPEVVVETEEEDSMKRERE